MSAISDMFSEGEFTIPFKLTEEEIQDRQAKYFDLKADIDIEDENLADAKAHYKAQTDPLKKAQKDLWLSIQSGSETRKVIALEVMNDDNFTVNYCDPANVDVVWYTREMTPAEKTQYKIKFNRAKRKEKELFG